MPIPVEQQGINHLAYHDALGMMMWLMNHAEYHSQWPLWSVDIDIIPALLYGQCKLYFDDHQNPVGFVTWAWLDEACKKQMLDNEIPLAFEQWNCGSIAMVNDLVAPWGHAKEIIYDLKHNIFSHYKVLSIRRHADGAIRRINYWKGIHYKSAVMKEQRDFNMRLSARSG